MKQRIKCSRSYFIALAAIAFLALAPSVWSAGQGVGKLDVSNGNTVCDPAATGDTGTRTSTHYNIFSGESVQLHIAPIANICTAGPSNKINDTCSTNADCSSFAACGGNPKTCNAGSRAGLSCSTSNDCPVVQGTCQLALECSGDTNVFVRGHTNTACTSDSDCSAAEGETACDTDAAFCKFIDVIPATVVSNTIDVCYTMRDDACTTTVVAYCGDQAPGDFGAVIDNPEGGQTFVQAGLRPVVGEPDAEGKFDEIVCVAELKTCVNEIGSQCCGLTQGAYGAPNSVATAVGNGDCVDPQGMGYIPAAICAGVNPFTGDPNATTVGVHPTRSVTVNNLTSLIGYLPSGSTANTLKNVNDKHYSAGPFDSKGDGGGVLTGQTMACQLNAFLSANGFTDSGFGGFTLAAQVCTQRSGSDKILGNTDDVHQTFTFPSCVVGKTVQQVIDAANQLLGNTANSLGCTASELNNVLSNVNVMFDQCGQVETCQ